MRNLLAGCVAMGAFALIGTGFAQPSVADEPPATGASAGSTASRPVVETLLSTPLAGVEGTDVIVSRVTMPPNTTLPKHWHPGEEFAYVIEGSAILRRDGQADLITKKGDAVAIPLKQVHTAVTTEQGATLLVFRVHEHGQPERVLVD